MTPKWFGWIGPIIALLVVLSFVPLVMIYLHRATHSPDPRISIIPDMDSQEKFKTQSLNLLFADHRAMRPRIAGTVAVGMVESDDHFYRGIDNGRWATTFPKQVPLNAELMARGQERFSIYCAPCHGLDGSGNGIVSLRAEKLAEGTWVPAANYHTDTVRNRPVGHVFNTITNGIRTMPAYGTQIPPADRWAIVAYLRALQLSQDASLADVPADKRTELENQAAAESPQGQPGSQTAPSAAAGGKAAAAGGAAPAGKSENKSQSKDAQTGGKSKPPSPAGGK